MTVGVMTLSSLVETLLAGLPDDRGLAVLEIGIRDDGLSAALDALAGSRVERFVGIDTAEVSATVPGLAEQLDDRGHDLLRLGAADYAAFSSERFDLILAHAPGGPNPWFLRLTPGGALVLEGEPADQDGKTFLRLSQSLVADRHALRLPWSVGDAPRDSLVLRMSPKVEAGMIDLFLTRLDVPLPAGNTARSARALGLNRHSVFESPAEMARISFTPAEAPPEWKLTVRSTLWHEDLDTRHRLIQELVTRDFGGDADYQHLVEQGWVALSAPLGDVEDIVEKAGRLFDERGLKDEKYRGDDGSRYRFVLDPVLHLPELSRLLENQRVNQLVRRYMGQDAIYSFGLLESMPAGVDVYDSSGLWHHDKVGNRLKAFFLLCDVTPEGRPTYFVPGSHLLDWPDYHYQGSRFSDEWVRSHFEVISLTGKKGDVVLIDTNALHRGNYELRRLGRQAFVAEYSNPIKSWKLDAIGYFPDGIKPHRLPLGLDLDKTLVDRSELVAEGDCYAYGRVRPPGIFPNFN
jgi:hypothetical protein